MIINNILELEYAIKENNIKNIKKILKKNPEKINKIEINRFIDIINFNEFDLFDNILKLISSKLKKNLLSNNIIFLNLLKSNNINFINKYIKYINLDLLHNNNNIIKFCTETTNFELVEIIYKIYKTTKKYSLLNNILVFYKNNNIKVNLELIKFLIKIDKKIVKDFCNNSNSNHNVPTIAYASLINNLELLNILKKAGVIFNYEKFNILNFYYNKVKEINNDIVLYLLNNNVNINICDNELWLTAHYVFFNPELFSLEVKKIILEKTKNINIQNTLGNTPLHYLVYNDNIDNYKDILIKKELDIFIKNKGLYTPLSLAEIKKQNLIDLAVKSFFYHININNKSVKFSPEKAKEYILKNKTTIYNKNINT
jgi:ankyrin repeat protein